LGVKSKKKRLAASLLQEEAVVIQARSRRFFWLIAEYREAVANRKICSCRRRVDRSVAAVQLERIIDVLFRLETRLGGDRKTA
jgi:hypothetical protein